MIFCQIEFLWCVYVCIVINYYLFQFKRPSTYRQLSRKSRRSNRSRKRELRFPYHTVRQPMEPMYLRIISFSICAGSIKAYKDIRMNINTSTEGLRLNFVGPIYDTPSDANKKLSYHAYLSFSFVFAAWSVIGVTTSINKDLLLGFFMFHNGLKYHKFVGLNVPHFSIISLFVS